MLSVTRFGAIGDGKFDCTEAITAAVTAAVAATSAARRAVVHFPPGGIFLTGPFNLSSHLVLQIDGTIRGVIGEAAERRWPRLPPLPTYGRDRDGARKQRHQALLMVAGAESVTITGTGVIDGQGEWWWERRHRLSAGRPHLLEFFNCSRIELLGLTLRNSPFWTVHPVYSEHVHIHHLTIRAPLYSPNTDGVDPDSSKHVLIEHNDISCGDDHVAVKSGLSAIARDAFPTFITENVTVRHNVLRTGMGITVGSETSGGVRGISVHHNVIHGQGWSVALHIKTNPHRGNMVEGVSFRHNTVYNTTGFMRLETNYQMSGRDALPSAYPPTVARQLEWISNTYRSGDVRPRSKFLCPGEYRTCHDVKIKDNRMPAESSWRCAHVSSFEVTGNAPRGLRKCMRDGRKKAPTAKKGGKKRPRREDEVRTRKRGTSDAGEARQRKHRRTNVKAVSPCPFCALRDARWSGRGDVG